jgi:hypothetical protein
MAGLAIGVVGIGIAFLVVMVMLSRMGRQRKQQAIDDFEREREATKPPDILELVQEEIVELGIDKIDGADGIDPSVLLQVYRRDEVNCADGATKKFVLADKVEAGDAGPDTVSLVCDEDD